MKLSLMKERLISSCGLLILMSLLALSTSVVAKEWTYTVRSGDNLWNITERHLTSINYVKHLQQLNRIENAYKIPPGTKLRVPIAWTKQNDSDVYAQVKNVQGPVTVKRTSTSEKLLVKYGMRLSEGDEIQSEDDAFITLQFSDGSRMRVQQNSSVRLKNLMIFGDFGLVDTFIELLYGRTESSVPTDSEGDTRFRIKTPFAISSVRGTDFRVGMTEEETSTSSEVLTGLVQVSGDK